MTKKCFFSLYKTYSNNHSYYKNVNTNFTWSSFSII